MSGIHETRLDHPISFPVQFPSDRRLTIAQKQSMGHRQQNCEWARFHSGVAKNNRKYLETKKE